MRHDKISKVVLTAYRFEVENLGLGAHSGLGVSNYEYIKGSKLPVKRLVVQIQSQEGLTGEFAVSWGSTDATFGQMCMAAPHLLGRDPETREEIYDDLKRDLRAYDRMGTGPLDIALWDLAGKKYDTSVSKLLGGYRTRLPVYASTHHGQESPGGLDTPQAFADFAADPYRRYGLSELDNIHTEHEQQILRYRFNVSEDLQLTATLNLLPQIGVKKR